MRIVLGLAWIFFGISKFLPMANSPALPGPAMAFLGAMAATSYFIPFVGICEILVGVLLVTNWWVPLAMMILSPLMVNVILFNAFLAPSAMGLVMLFVLTALQLYVMRCTWSAYRPLLARRTTTR